MWVFHPELMMNCLAIQAKLMAEIAQRCAELLAPPERGLIVPYRPRVRVPHHHEEPAKILRLADHR